MVPQKKLLVKQKKTTSPRGQGLCSTILSRPLPIEVFCPAHPPPPRQWLRPPGGNFHQPHAEKYGHQIGSFPHLRDEHEKYCKPPPRFRYMKQWYDECTQNLRIVVFSPERSLIIKDMLGIYIVYIKPMTIRSWIPFEAKHIGCMHATVKCQNHWSTNFSQVVI